MGQKLFLAKYYELKIISESYFGYGYLWFDFYRNAPRYYRHALLRADFSTDR